MMRVASEPTNSRSWLTKISVPGGALYELAGNGDPTRLDAFLPKGDRVEAMDMSRGTRRIATISGGRLNGVLFVTRTGLLPSRDWLIRQLEADNVGGSVLAARGPGSQPDKGATICVCFDIGLNQIVAAIRDRQLVDVPAVGKTLGAGTNCGSCRPAIASSTPPTITSEVKIPTGIIIQPCARNIAALCS